MTDEEMRIAIAEACGLSRCPCGNANCLRGKDGNLWLPDYLNDLNAMHEAEETLTANQFDELFYYWLAYAVSQGKCEGQIWEYRKLMAHATARQRAEAFLRAIGKWKED